MKAELNKTHHVPLREEEVGADVLEVMSETFFQPDVLPPDRGHQIAKPLEDRHTQPADQFNPETSYKPELLQTMEILFLT